MNIGLLNIRITIQKNTLTTDAIGNQINTWQDYFSCCATGGSESGTETNNAGQVQESDNIAFTVRYCPETLAVTSTGYRVLCNGEIYNITHIDHMNFKRKTLKIWCSKVRRS